MKNNSPKQQVFDQLLTNGIDAAMLDAQGKTTLTPTDADIFSFDFEVNGTNYGTVVVMFTDTSGIEIYFGDNLGRSMYDDDKQEWYDFLYQIRMLAKRSLLSFSLKNLNRLKYNMQSMANIKEGLFESYYGNKKVSYSDQPSKTRLIINHNKTIGENDARYRFIESLFVETADGERFKLPFTKIIGGRAMARHIAEGGKPYDSFGQHLSQIVDDINVLRRFTRASDKQVLEGGANDLVNDARSHYTSLKKRLKGLAGQRFYRTYKEAWDPAAVLEHEYDVNGIRNLFVEHNIDGNMQTEGWNDFWGSMGSKLYDVAHGTPEPKKKDTTTVSPPAPDKKPTCVPSTMNHNCALEKQQDILNNESCSKPKRKLKLPEDNVVRTKFATKLAQSGKEKYIYNDDVASSRPKYNPTTMKNVVPGLFTSEDKDYVSFYASKIGNKNTAHMYGVTDSVDGGLPIIVGTTRPDVALALVDAYNRGNRTDKDIRKIPMKEINAFDKWASMLVEGTWALPDSRETKAELAALMNKPLIVGADATNATEQLYDLLGDDRLYELLTNLAEDDPDANIWDDEDVVDRIEDLIDYVNDDDYNMQESTIVPGGNTSGSSQLPAATKTQPVPPTAPTTTTAPTTQSTQAPAASNRNKINQSPDTGAGEEDMQESNNEMQELRRLSGLREADTTPAQRDFADAYKAAGYQAPAQEYVGTADTSKWINSQQDDIDDLRVDMAKDAAKRYSVDYYSDSEASNPPELVSNNPHAKQDFDTAYRASSYQAPNQRYVGSQNTAKMISNQQSDIDDLRGDMAKDVARRTRTVYNASGERGPIPAYIETPESVDQMRDLRRLSGLGEAATTITASDIGDTLQKGYQYAKDAITDRVSEPQFGTNYTMKGAPSTISTNVPGQEYTTIRNPAAASMIRQQEKDIATLNKMPDADQTVSSFRYDNRGNPITSRASSANVTLPRDIPAPSNPDLSQYKQRPTKPR
jgi:hypothetical protein